MPEYRQALHLAGAPAGSDPLRLCEGLGGALCLAEGVRGGSGLPIDKADSLQAALSKYTRKPTRERLAAKIATKQMFVEEELERLASRIW